MPAALIADLDDLDLEAMKALIRAQHEQLSSRASEIAHLKLLLDKLQRMLFGAKSEKLVRQVAQLEQPRGTQRYRATREAVAVDAGQSLKGEDVVRTLNRLKSSRGAPQVLFCDNGSEFTSQVMDLWAYRNGVKIDFSRPGKPTDNAFVESFNGTFRSECLNIHWFMDLKEAKQLIEAWRQEYNESRPHASLDDRTPSEFASQITARLDLAAT